VRFQCPECSRTLREPKYAKEKYGGGRNSRNG
jgi:hypothetical protein